MELFINSEVEIPFDGLSLKGSLCIPKGAGAIIVFAHGSGSSRYSLRNKMVATYLQGCGIGTLLFDLLTLEEDSRYANRFDLTLLTRRLVGVVDWIRKYEATQMLTVGLFGASTGAAAALNAAALLPSIAAIVCRGGRPDLALDSLNKVKAPALFIVGSDDPDVIALNEMAMGQLHCEKQLAIVRGASHLFEETGKLEEVAELAAEWFTRRLVKSKVLV